MEVNFDFVKNSSFKEAFPTAEKIHKLYTIDDYRDVISNSRLLLESLIKKIFKLENLSPYYTVHDGEHRNLRNNTHYLRNELDYPLSIMDLFDEIRRMGNAAVHDNQIEPDQKQAWHCICDLHDILVFLINSYDGQDLYYLRPDIAMEAQTDEDHYYVRQNKQPKIMKLHDHQNTKKKQSVSAPKKAKHVKHFSSKQHIEQTNSELQTKTTPSTKDNWLRKIKELFHHD